jgi:ABC-type proline/glycine betaine transport system substrate-binding protein
MMIMVGSITTDNAQSVTTFSIQIMDCGLTKGFTVQVVTITMSGLVMTATLNNGMATDTTVRRMTRMRIVVQSIVTRTDLAHTSLARVNTISALS